MNCVKRSVTLPKGLNSFVEKRARKAGKARGQQPNFSAALADIIIEARNKKAADAMAKAA